MSATAWTGGVVSPSGANRRSVGRRCSRQACILGGGCRLVRKCSGHCYCSFGCHFPGPPPIGTPPNNRNNNSGFRVVCLSHVLFLPGPGAFRYPAVRIGFAMRTRPCFRSGPYSLFKGRVGGVLGLMRGQRRPTTASSGTVAGNGTGATANATAGDAIVIVRQRSLLSGRTGHYRRPSYW